MAQDGKKQYVEVPKKVTREQALEIGRQLFDAIATQQATDAREAEQK